MRWWICFVCSKQKPAYEMRISDWGSDVCSSDLLQDVLTAIREKTTVDALGFRRERFMDRALKSPAEMERRFALFPDAIQATADIAAACRFDLAEIRYQYPYEEVMAGRSAQEALAALTEEGARTEEHKSELQSLMRISYAVFC